MNGVDLMAPAVSARRRRSRRRRLRTAVVLVAAIVVATAGTVLGLKAVRSGSVVTPACTVTGAANHRYTVSPEQAQNAAIIAAVAQKDQLPDHAVTVAEAVSLQEARLTNLPYGDRDSVGLFQQRPSQGWGTEAQLLDPTFAASAFYRRLAQIPGWQALPVTQSAQAVQLSAAPSAYAVWEDEARALAIALTGEVAAGLSCHFNGFGGDAPTSGALGQALASERGSNLLGTPLNSKTGWQVASWAVAHAYDYHLRSVSFAGQTWQSRSGKWTADRGRYDPRVVTAVVG
jgi:hypothetical protein